MSLPSKSDILKMGFIVDGTPYVNICTKPDLNVDKLVYTLDSEPWYGEKTYQSSTSDLLGYIKSLKEQYQDITAGITATSTLTTLDLTAFIKVFSYAGTSDISTDIRAFLVSDVNVSIKGKVESITKDLFSLIEGFPYYWSETYTYIKHCPKYIIDYGSSIQIIEGRCVYGGIRDLYGLVSASSIEASSSANLLVFIVGHCSTCADLLTYITGKKHSYTSDLTSNVGVHSPIDLSANSSSHMPFDLSVFSGGHLPVNLSSTLHSWEIKEFLATISTHSPMDLASNISTHLPANMSAVIGTHPVVNLSAVSSAHLPVDLRLSLHSYDMLDLVGLVSYHLPYDLNAEIRMHSPVDLTAYSSVHMPANLSAVSGGHLPTDLPSAITSFYLKDISAYIDMHQPYNLEAIILMHLPQNLEANIYGFPPANLLVYVGGHLPKNLLTLIHGWEYVGLDSLVTTHQPVNLEMYLHVRQHMTSLLEAGLHGWAEKYLPALIRSCYCESIPAIMSGVFPVDLSAYLKTYPMKSLTAIIFGWGYYELTGYLHAMFKKNLLANIIPIPSINLYSIITPLVSLYNNLDSYIRAFQTRDLSAISGAVLKKDLYSCIFAVKDILLSAVLHGWQEYDLYANIDGIDYPYHLTASIVARYNVGNLMGSIHCFRMAEAIFNLGSTLKGYQCSDLMSYIEIISGSNLSAWLTATGGSKDLHATLYPRVVRLTKVINVMTMEKLDLSAMINISCFGSMFKDLYSYIKPIYMWSLPATIWGRGYVKQTLNLTAKIGYDNSILVVDELPITIKTCSDPYKTFDTLPLCINIMGGMRSLSAYITGAMIEKDLSARISCIRIEDYLFENSLNRLQIYDVDPRFGKAKLSKIVEIMFNNYVKDYVYLEKGKTAFSYFLENKWEVGIKSFLPATKQPETKRKLYKAINIFNILKYKSIDEAMKAAIDYVTEVPKYDLNAVINLHFNSLAINLSAHILPRYTHQIYSELNSEINCVSPAILVSTETDVHFV